MIRSLLITIAAITASAAHAQSTIPDGTKLRVRLDQTISSGTADEGQAVELSGFIDVPNGLGLACEKTQSE